MIILMLFGNLKIDKLINRKINLTIFFSRLACQCNAIILQLTESEKNTLVNLYMDQKTNDQHLLTYNLKSRLNQKDYLKYYIGNEYITVEGISLPLVGSSKQVYCIMHYILFNNIKYIPVIYLL